MAAETPKMSVENDAAEVTPGKEEPIPTGVAFFDKLPAEIRNEIYYLAYVVPGDQVVKITSVKEIVQRERHRRRYPDSRTSQSQRGLNSSSLAAGTCPLYQMMVSRQFFEEASTKWLRSVIIQGENTHFVQFTKYCAQSQAMNSGLTSVNTAWPTGILYNRRLKPTFADVMRKCKGLRLLQIHVPEDAFEDVDKITCVHDLTTADFASLEPVKDILESTSLQWVETIAMASKEAQTPAEHAKWKANVEALGQYINKELEARRIAREEDANSLSPGTTLQMATSPTMPAQTYSLPSPSESPVAQEMLDRVKDMMSLESTQKQPQATSREALEEKVARMEGKVLLMEEEIKGLKQRLDAITGSQAA